MACHFIPISQWEKFKYGDYTIVIAETVCQSKQGLQNVSNIPTNTLILFNNVSGLQHFHTKNCRFPIDIISLDTNGVVLSIWTANPGLSLIGPTPLTTKYALESHAGWAKNNQIKVGSNLKFLIKKN